MVQGIFDLGIGQTALSVEMGDKTPGVNTAVRAGTAEDGDLFGEDPGEVLFKQFLYRASIFLALPAFIARALEPEVQTDRPV